jgi:hypothetical protein
MVGWGIWETYDRLPKLRCCGENAISIAS